MNVNSQIADIMGQDAYQKSQLKTDNELCDIQIDYIQYYRKSKYWKYINSEAKASALHDYFAQLRGFCTVCTEDPEGDDEPAALQPKGEYRAEISEFFRDGELVSLRSSYAGRSVDEHGWHGADGMNFGGSDCGSFTLEDLFALDEGHALQIIKRCDEILKRDGSTFTAAEGKAQISLADKIDGTFLTASDMLGHFNFNDHGIVLNFSSVVGLPRAAGELEMTVPWTAWDFEVAEAYEHVQIAKFIYGKKNSAHS